MALNSPTSGSPKESHLKGIEQSNGQALGGYAFLWGNKMEATPTWFGMWLDDGARLGTVDAMSEIWTGNAPANLAPRVEPLELDGSPSVKPGATVQVRASAEDPEGKPLRATWVLRQDSGELQTGGDFRPYPLLINDVVAKGDIDGATVTMPDEPGPYRVYYTAYDDAGNAATANLPLLVEGERGLRLPLSVYEDGFDGMPWVPSGWMGGTEFLSLDGESRDRVHEGAHSIRMRYEGKSGWAGVAWQHPANNWGDQEGGFDLTGAEALEFWARGEYGGEKIGFGVGLLGADRKYPDSGIAKVDGVVLTKEWQKYRVKLNRVDLSSIKTGFFVTLAGRRTPVTIYLDSIRFVR